MRSGAYAYPSASNTPTPSMNWKRSSARSTACRFFLLPARKRLAVRIRRPVRWASGHQELFGTSRSNGYGQFGAADPLARAGRDWSFAIIPRSSLLLADIGNGSAAITCFKSAQSAALSASSRSTVTIYKGTKRRLLCGHFVQGAPRSGLSQRPGERSTPKLIVRPVILAEHAGSESNRARHPRQEVRPDRLSQACGNQGERQRRERRSVKSVNDETSIPNATSASIG